VTVASYTIIDRQDGSPYLTVAVSFDEHTFVQTLVTAATGHQLEAVLTAYADDYAASYVAPISTVEGD
jgi:hypothetical protein